LCKNKHTQKNDIPKNLQSLKGTYSVKLLADPADLFENRAKRKHCYKGKEKDLHKQSFNVRKSL